MEYVLLPEPARTEKRNEIQQKTIDDILRIWETKQSAILIRPTGFGKTYTAANIINLEDPVTKQKRFKKILFLYPLLIIEEAFFEDIEKMNKLNKKLGQGLIDVNNITTMTYMNLQHQIKNDNKNKQLATDYDLIIFDEFHSTGAEGTGIACRTIIDWQEKDVKTLGMTATYERADKVNMSDQIFSEMNLVFEYSYGDAVRDGLMPTLMYYTRYKEYLAYRPDGSLDEQLLEVLDCQYDKSNINKIIVGRSLRDIQHNYGNLIRIAVSEVLGFEYLTGKAPNTRNADKYKQRGQRWIVFYNRKEDQIANKDELELSFKTAFPTATIKILVCNEDTDGLEKLCASSKNNQYLNPKPNTVVVISCLRQLNMGYHTGELDGAILLAETSSKITYQQQLGRTLNTFRVTKPIIIDLVGNENNVTATNTGNKTNSGGKELVYESCFSSRCFHLDDPALSKLTYDEAKQIIIDRAAKSIVTMLFMYDENNEHLLTQQNLSQYINGLKLRAVEQIRTRVTQYLDSIKLRQTKEWPFYDVLADPESRDYHWKIAVKQVSIDDEQYDYIMELFNNL